MSVPQWKVRAVLHRTPVLGAMFPVPASTWPPSPALLWLCTWEFLISKHHVNHSGTICANQHNSDQNEFIMWCCCHIPLVCIDCWFRSTVTRQTDYQNMKNPRRMSESHHLLVSCVGKIIQIKLAKIHFLACQFVCGIVHGSKSQHRWINIDIWQPDLVIMCCDMYQGNQASFMN